ncbi:MAG: zinc-binding alcohol dehydrogenase [Planctomycetes bacterium]|nr:zinc-binding alcohol dehydrogenase [Planctomycetota bacterium]
MSAATAVAGMRVVEWVGSGRARVAEHPLPVQALGEDEVEGPTLVSLVSPGTELQSFLRDDPKPRGSGYASVFRIARRGAAVTGLAEGQAVFAMGRHASFQRFKARDVVALPDGLAPETAVFCRLMGVSWTTLVTTAARPADRVLVTGLGIVGHLAAQNFKAAGYRVTAVDPVAWRRERAQRAGIADVLAQAPAPEPDGTFALAVECSGHEDAVLSACRAVRKGGEVVLVGVPWQRRSEASAHALLDLVFHRYVRLRSGWEWELPHHPQAFGRGSIFDSFRGALHWLHEGRVQVAGLSRTFAPEQAQEALSGLAGRDAEHLTALFEWR